MAVPRGARQRVAFVVEHLAAEYPGSARELCALSFENPFQLLAATILSAQTTDIRVNMVTPVLFARYPEPMDLARADVDVVEEIVRSTGFFRAKTKSLLGMAQALVKRFGSEVPTEMADLVTVPGVGRKTANVVRSVAFDLPGLPVDTHVGRLTRRLGLTKETDPERVESDVCAMVAPAEWGALSLRLILHGRAVCVARAPRCGECSLAEVCPSAGLTPSKPVKKAPTGARTSPVRTAAGQKRATRS